MCASKSLAELNNEKAVAAIEREVEHQFTVMSGHEVSSRIQAIIQCLIESGVGREDAIKKAHRLSNDVSGRMRIAAYEALYAALSDTMRQVIVQRIVNATQQPKS